MGYAWAIVMQVLFLSLLMIPGVRGVQSWYLVISQLPVWYIMLHSFQGRKYEHVRTAVEISAWVCVATVVLAFVTWGRCSTALDCSTGAISAAITLAVAVGLILSNVHSLDIVEAEGAKSED